MNPKLIHSTEWRYRLSRHGLFWLIYLVGYSFIDLDVYGPFGGLQLAIRWMPFAMLNTYVVVYWLVDRFLLKARYRAFFGWLIIWSLITVFLAFLTHLYLAYPYCWDPGPRPSFRQALPELTDLGAAPGLIITDVQRVGEDLRLLLRPGGQRAG